MRAIFKNTGIVLTCLIIFSSLSGCLKDPFEGVENHERAIEDFKIGEGFTQIGSAEINRDDQTVVVQVLITPETDFSNVTPWIQASYGATIFPASGEIVDFDNPDKSVNYTVTSQTGETRIWTISIKPFVESLTGVYQIKQLSLYGGTGPEFGGGEVLNLMDKPWIWPETGGPDAELDNTLTFTLEGINEEGNTYGTVINDAGPDGKYADFQFVGNPVMDVNYIYRKIPKGKSTWTHNFDDNTVTFTAADGFKSTATIENSQTINLGNDNVKILENEAFQFTLNGEDDWDNIYSDYDKFVKHPRFYWIEVSKTGEDGGNRDSDDSGEQSDDNFIQSFDLGRGITLIGSPEIDMNDATVDINIFNSGTLDLTNIKPTIHISDGAAISPQSGESVNFDDANHIVKYTVISASGIAKDWNVRLHLLDDDLIGIYHISGFSIYGGTSPADGGTAVFNFLSDKPWDWLDGGPAAELDNTLTFTFEGVDDQGNTYGSLKNDAGTDGKYADFLFVTTPDDERKETEDVNHFYRKIPVGVSGWSHNLSTGVVTFTSGDGSTSEAVFRQPGVIDLGNGVQNDLQNQAFEFALEGHDDWDNIYNDYDKIVSNPRKFWIEVNK